MVKTYRVYCNGVGYRGVVDAQSAAEAIEKARATLCRYPEYSETDQPEVYYLTVISDDGEQADAKLVLNPMPPLCTLGGEHIWVTPPLVVGGYPVSPGVSLHYGGLRFVARCARCAARRTVTTWDVSFGSVPCRTVSYRSGTLQDFYQDIINCGQQVGPGAYIRLYVGGGGQVYLVAVDGVVQSGEAISCVHCGGFGADYKWEYRSGSGWVCPSCIPYDTSMYQDQEVDNGSSEEADTGTSGAEDPTPDQGRGLQA